LAQAKTNLANSKKSLALLRKEIERKAEATLNDTEISFKENLNRELGETAGD